MSCVFARASPRARRIGLRIRSRSPAQAASASSRVIVSSMSTFRPPGTSLLFWDSTANTASAGSATCGGSSCQIVYWGSSITLHGAGFVAGVPVTMPVPGAATVSIAPDSTGQFTVTITPSGSGDIDEPVTATQTSGNGQLSASALVAFEDPPQ
jgi:hypothetical protein